MANYFNTLPLRLQLEQLGTCEFMDSSEFADGVKKLEGKKVVIIGCGAQGLNQGLNMRDSGLDISYTLRPEAIRDQRQSYKNATSNGFNVGTYDEMIPTADLVINLTPDKQHTAVITAVMPLIKKGATLSYSHGFNIGTYDEMIPTADLVINLTPDKQHTAVITAVMPLIKKGATLSYSHGFNIVEEGMQIRKDITVIMVAPKSPCSEVRAEYLRGFGVPTLIAVHPENDPNGDGFEIAKAYCVGTGGHNAGVLKSSFVAEVKSDLMGEQTILCGLLQTGAILSFNKMIEKGIEKGYASKLVQYGIEVVTEALKHGGITNMMDRLSNPAKIKAFELSEELKEIMRPLFWKHMDNIMSGDFSKTMMEDWANDDKNLLTWRAETGKTAFEKTPAGDVKISEQEYFDNGVLMIAFIKSGVELAFETMTQAGIKAESAYYESLHETPLIANTIARKKLFEMNRVISDTAEYGCCLLYTSD